MNMTGKRARRCGRNRHEIHRTGHKVKSPAKVAKMGWQRTHLTRARMKAQHGVAA